MNNKFFITLVSLVLAVFAIYKIKFNDDTTEGFGYGHQGAAKVFQSVKTPCGSYGLRGMKSPDKFVSYPSFQSMLSPRMSGMLYLIAAGVINTTRHSG